MHLISDEWGSSVAKTISNQFLMFTRYRAVHYKATQMKKKFLNFIITKTTLFASSMLYFKHNMINSEFFKLLISSSSIFKVPKKFSHILSTKLNIILHFCQVKKAQCYLFKQYSFFLEWKNEWHIFKEPKPASSTSCICYFQYFDCIYIIYNIV